MYLLWLVVPHHPASRAFSYGIYALYRENALRDLKEQSRFVQSLFFCVIKDKAKRDERGSVHRVVPHYSTTKVISPIIKCDGYVN